MKTRLMSIWEALRSSFWLVPAVMTGLSIGLSFGTAALDAALHERLLKRIEIVWIGGPEGAREILSTIASSMITVAGVVFSITAVVLALASSQFGPRIVRNFTRDRGNQIVLGTFIATFTYCLLVLRTVRDDDAATFVPSISVTVGILTALASLAVLIYFIHHVASMIQAPVVIWRVAQELNGGIDELFPEQLGHGKPPAPPRQAEENLPAALHTDGKPVPAPSSGYLQAIDNDTLMETAAEADIVILIKYRPGHFITEGTELAAVWPLQRFDEKSCERVQRAFLIGMQRTETQDVEFAVRQLVEIAVRALSPGINDPFTAMNCIDYLGASLCKLAGREIPSPFRYDKKGQLRVIAASMVTFEGALDAAFDMIRQSGRSSVAVTIRLLETIGVVAKCVQREDDRRALIRQASMIKAAADDAFPESLDKEAVQKRFNAAMVELVKA